MSTALRRRTRLRQWLAPVLFAILVLPLTVAPGPILAQDLVLRGGNIVDVVTGQVRVASVIVRNGLIAEVTNTPPDPALDVLDVTDRWIVPGLVELHTHTTDTVALRRALGLGITSTLTIRTPPDSFSLEPLSALPGVPLPREHTVAGRFTGGFPRPDPLRWAPQTPREAEAYLDSLRAAGYTRIKIWMDDFSLQREATVPVLNDPTFAALLGGARARDMRAYVHALEARWYRKAVEGQATWVIHPMFPDSLTERDTSALKAAGMGWTSAMSVVADLGDSRRYARMVVADPRLVETLSDERYTELARLSGLETNPGSGVRPIMVREHERYLRVIARNTRLASANGVTLSVGSDRTAGFGTHVEIELLRDYGVDATVILRAATLGGTEALGTSSSFGTIDEGKVADLLVLTTNPLDDITNLRDVDWVIKGGRPWRAADLRR